MAFIHAGNPKSRRYEVPETPVRFPREGNPLYPLPADYHSLTADGQRLARVNALCLRDSAEDRVVAWSLCRDWYWLKMPAGSWYMHGYAADSPYHYAMIHDLFAYPRTVQGFPRSFGKSTKIREFWALNMLTEPYFIGSHIKSNVKFVRSDFLKLKRFFTFAPVVDDFGKLEPAKGEGGWSNEHLCLSNGAELHGMSIMSPQQGPRPKVWIIDDGERDDSMRINPTLLTENMETLLGILVPQLDEGGSGHVIGTLNNVRMMIYRMARTPEAEDPSLAFWHRVIYAIYDETGQLTWPEKFSEERVQALREELTEEAFNAGYMNQPGSKESRVLTLHPKLGHYNIEEPDDYLIEKPLHSQSTLVSWKAGPSDEPDESPIQVIRRPFGKTVTDMYRVLLVDPCRKPGPRSDYASLLVVGRERSGDYRDVLWLLDLCVARLDRNQIVEKAWELGKKWRVRVIGCEATSGFQHNLFERMRGQYRDRAEAESWSPFVDAITYKGDAKKDKGTRIADALIWRFELNKIKMPLGRSSDEAWAQMYYQVNNFTQDLKLLPFDDALDSLAMFHYIVKPSGGYSGGDDSLDTGSLVDMIRRGDYFMPGTNIPIIAVLPTDYLTQAVLASSDQAKSKAAEREPRAFSSGRRVV